MENMMTVTAKAPEIAPAIMEQKLTREVSEIEFKAESYVIQNDEDYAAAGEFGKMTFANTVDFCREWIIINRYA